MERTNIDIIGPQDAAALLKIHLKTVYKLAQSGRIPGKRIGRSWRFNKAELIKLITDGEKIASQ
jgi:excisionase family DNA binding protein